MKAGDRMKPGDLVRVIGFEDIMGGMILSVCDDLGITTIDVLLHDGRIIYDQRPSNYEVSNEGR